MSHGRWFGWNQVPLGKGTAGKGNFLKGPAGEGTLFKRSKDYRLRRVCRNEHLSDPSIPMEDWPALEFEHGTLWLDRDANYAIIPFETLLKDSLLASGLLCQAHYENKLLPG